jgi:hypothetical protein
MKEFSREELEQLSQDMSRSLGREVRIAPSEALDQRTAAEMPRTEETVETLTGVAVGGGTLGTVAMVL